MFCITLDKNQINYSVRLCLEFFPILRLKTCRCVEAILIQLGSSQLYFMEMKLELLKKFIPTVTCIQLERLITIFLKLTEEALDKDSGFVISNLNPLLIILHMLDISQ